MQKTQAGIHVIGKEEYVSQSNQSAAECVTDSYSQEECDVRRWQEAVGHQLQPRSEDLRHKGSTCLTM